MTFEPHYHNGKDSVLPISVSCLNRLVEILGGYFSKSDEKTAKFCFAGRIKRF